MINEEDLLKAGFAKYDENSYRKIKYYNTLNEMIIEIDFDELSDIKKPDVLIQVGIRQYCLATVLYLNVEFWNDDSLTIAKLFELVEQAIQTALKNMKKV